MRIFFMLLRSLLSLIFIAASLAHGEPPRRDSLGDPLPEGAVFRIGTARLRHLPIEYPSCEQLGFSSDGKFLLSSSPSERVLCVLETATGRPVHRFPASRTHPVFALSPDGTAVTIHDSNTIELYELASGKRLRAVESHFPEITELIFPPDGKSLAALCCTMRDRRGVVRWDRATGKKIGESAAMSDDPLFVLSPDGRLAASMQEMKGPKPPATFRWYPAGGDLRLWDAVSGKPLRQWKTKAKVPMYGRCLAFSPEGRTIAAADVDAAIRIWDTSSGKLLRKWKGRPNAEKSIGPPHVPVGDLVFAPDGRTLASVDENCRLRLWDWRTGRERRHFADVYGPVAFSRDGKMIAAAGLHFRIRLWDTKTGRDRCPFTDPGTIAHIAFSPDGRTLAAASEDGPSQLLDAHTGRAMRSLSGYRPIAFSPVGSRLLALRQDGKSSGPLCLMDAAGEKERVRFGDTSAWDGLGAWSADGMTLITTHAKEREQPSVVIHRSGFLETSTSSVVLVNVPVRIWDAATGKERRRLPGIPNYAPAICSPDARMVAVADDKDKSIRLYAADTGKPLRQLPDGHGETQYTVERYRKNTGFSQGSIRPVSPIFSPDGRSLLAGHDLKSFALWDVSNGKPILRFPCDQFCPEQAAFSPDGRLLALMDLRGDPCLVDAATGRVRHRLTRENGDLRWMIKSANRAFSADGRLLAAAYDDRTLVLWETATGRVVRTLSGHGKGQLRQMMFSPDGRRLATVSTDGTALVWDVVGMSRDGQLPMRKLTAEETEQAWRDLASLDAAKGHRAIWTLAADPEHALPLVRQRVHAVPRPEPGRIARLVTDLDSDSFAVRDQATRELRGLGESAEPKLRQVIGAQPSLELRRRTQTLLQELDAAPSGDRLRAHRAVAVLEYMNDRQSIELLRRLASGAAAASLTREATAALGRRKMTAEPQP